MKNFKLTFIYQAVSIILFFSSAHFLNAQETVPQLPEPAIKGNSYKTGIGLRAGGTSGLTFKQFVGNRHAIEAIVGLWHHGVSATALYEHHTNAFNVDGLNWLYGIGAHVSYQTGDQYFYHTSRNGTVIIYEPHVFGIGVDGIFGMEFKIPNAPISVSLDMKPYMEFMSNNHIRGAVDPGLSVRAVF